MNMCFRIFSILAILLFWGCYPKGPVYYSDSDLVATIHDDSFAFGNQTTYVLADSVVHIFDPNEPEPDIDRTYDEDMLNRVEANMNQRSFERVDSLNNADFLVTVSAWTNTHTDFVYGWGGYWGWYWDPYYPWYPGGWYYPWGGFVYSYTFGTVTIEIIDINGIIPEEEFVPVVWKATLNGALSNSTADIRSRILNGIDKSFEQSPYLISE